MIIFKGRHFPKDLILMAMRWKLAYPLSYRNIEELMEERGADIDHLTVQKWGIIVVSKKLHNIPWDLNHLKLHRQPFQELSYIECLKKVK